MRTVMHTSAKVSNSYFISKNSGVEVNTGKARLTLCLCTSEKECVSFVHTNLQLDSGNSYNKNDEDECTHET